MTTTPAAGPPRTSRTPSRVSRGISLDGTTSSGRHRVLLVTVSLHRSWAPFLLVVAGQETVAAAVGEQSASTAAARGAVSGAVTEAAAASRDLRATAAG